ncbi:Sec-independent protein translocase protein TatA [uncultured delta proteobacterium]|uniref:Sec-independent protein translocase protein TatA n=1 Tax=uncultured delta proteobacterium TaxID=34034 RepID=A0A212J095_9DELT|nr:Sec-independent protein translocase protein TatA [uncultured delta proteobacterium]
MGKIGIWQLVVIFGVFVVLFGYKKLPEIGKTLGQGLRNFRRSMNEADEIDITPPAETKAEEKEKNEK